MKADGEENDALGVAVGPVVVLDNEGIDAHGEESTLARERDLDNIGPVVLVEGEGEGGVDGVDARHVVDAGDADGSPASVRCARA